MRLFILTMFALFFISCDESGELMEKRAAPTEVSPITVNGIQYAAPQQPEKIGHIKATNLANGKTSWHKVYHLEYEEEWERDIQWIFITEMVISEAKDSLVITREDRKKYLFNFKSNAVTSLPSGK